MQTYGYENGVLSNSMLQAAITCPLKYKLRYIDNIKADGTLYDATFAGNLAHYAIEHYEDDIASLKDCIYTKLAEYFPSDKVETTRRLMCMYDTAKEATYEDVRKWGREPKAPPEMYGYWKKNYSGLTTLFERLDSQMDEYVDTIDGKFGLPYSDIVKRAITSVTNWPPMKVGEATEKELVLKHTLTVEGLPDQPMSGTVDRVEARDGGIAICDYKTGKWPYDFDKVANSDQFYLYDLIMREQGHTVVEWVLYDIFANNLIRVTPNQEIRQAGWNRLTTNLTYFHQVKAMLDQDVAVPVPAGSSYKLGCPCIFAETGDCTYVYRQENN
jgi:hypothetical protein